MSYTQGVFPTDDAYLQVTSYTLPLAGLRREVTLLQLSDLHLAVAEESSAESLKARVAKQKQAWEPVRKDFARLYGDAFDPPHLLQPEEGLSHYLQLLQTVRPDVALFSGDMLEDFSEENLRCFSDFLGRVDCPWMWVRGNHERGHNDAYAPFTQGGKPAQTLSVGEFKLIGIDDADKRVTAEQTAAAWKEAEGCVPVLTMHIPALTAHNPEAAKVFDPYFLLGSGEPDPETVAFLDALQADGSPFGAVLCGHVHGRHVSSYRPGRMQFCASSGMVGACSYFRFTPEGA